MTHGRPSPGAKVFDIANYLAMGILALSIAFPFWHTLVLSLSGPAASRGLGLQLLPAELTLESYRQVFATDLISVGYFNTTIRAVIGTALTLLVTYCGAYALTKKEIPERNFLTLLVLFTIFFSGGLIPTYLNIRNLGLLETRWALILPPLTSAWYLVITRNFIATIPRELEEAASIDGAHPLSIVFRIFLPVSLPILAVLGLWSMVAHWNAWFDAYIYVRDQSKVVLQLALRRVLIEDELELLEMSMDARFLDQRLTTPESVKAATIIVTIGPVVVLYPFLQKYFVKGIFVGSLKG